MKAQQRGKIHSNPHQLHSAGNYDGTTGPPFIPVDSESGGCRGEEGTLTGAKPLGTGEKRREQRLHCIVKAHCAAAYCVTILVK